MITAGVVTKLGAEYPKIHHACTLRVPIFEKRRSVISRRSYGKSSFRTLRVRLSVYQITRNFSCSYNIQHTTYNIQHTTYNIQHTPYFHLIKSNCVEKAYYLCASHF